jgi:hypothetical protein
VHHWWRGGGAGDAEAMGTKLRDTTEIVIRIKDWWGPQTVALFVGRDFKPTTPLLTGPRE